MLRKRVETGGSGRLTGLKMKIFEDFLKPKKSISANKINGSAGLVPGLSPKWVKFPIAKQSEFVQ